MKGKRKYFILGAICLSGLVLVIHPKYRFRVMLIEKHITTIKYEKWGLAKSYIENNMHGLDWVVGKGFTRYYEKFQPWGNVENQYVQEFIDKGIFGVLIYILLLCSYFLLGYVGWRQLREDKWQRGIAWGLMPFSCVLIVHTLVESQYRSSIPWLLVIMGSIIIATLKNQMTELNRLSASSPSKDHRGITPHIL